MTKNKLFHLITATLFSLSFQFWLDLDEKTQAGLSIFIFIGWLWLTECLPITVTALLIPVLAVISGIFEVKVAFVEFANPVIFLFMGGFVLAAALQKHNIDQNIALKILSLSQGRPMVSFLLLFLITALLSMWISNTATVVMMLPLALALLENKKEQTLNNEPKELKSLYLFALLGLAYSANIGGMATLIGSPPNAIAASAVGLNFTDWLSIGLPLFILLFTLMIIILLIVYRPTFGEKFSPIISVKPINKEGKIVVIIFILTALGWMFSDKIANLIGISGSIDALIAVTAIIVLVAINALSIEEAIVKVNWPILLLFGGGLTLSAVLNHSGASTWLAHLISTYLPADNRWLVLLMICLFVIFLTELVSNTASAALLIPLFISVAVEFNLSSTAMAVVIALSASCAFMLPVATPPNAIVFASGYIEQKSMMKAGAILNVIFSIVIATAFWLFM
jgi:sodium-dependent dicarboxylate transporter 2/3/5